MKFVVKLLVLCEESDLVTEVTHVIDDVQTPRDLGRGIGFMFKERVAEIVGSHFTPEVDTDA